MSFGNLSDLEIQKIINEKKKERFVIIKERQNVILNDLQKNINMEDKTKDRIKNIISEMSSLIILLLEIEGIE